MTASEDTSPVAPKKTKSLKAAKVPKISKPVAREVTPDEDEEDDDQALALAGELASDDEDDMVDADAAFKEGQDVGKAPKPSRAIEIAAKAGKDEQEDTGVVYIGRIPHGFFEHQMKSYFEQVSFHWRDLPAWAPADTKFSSLGRSQISD